MLGNVAKFVMFKKPFEEVLTSENLIEVEEVGVQVKGETITELVKSIVTTQDYRVFPIIQGDLLEDGWEYPEGYDKKKGRFKTGNYTGNKWGGKYLRAPDIFYTVLEKGKDKLVKLGDIAEIRFGIKTGANDFFYLPNKYFSIKEDGEYYRLIPKQDGLPTDIEIEKEFLKPVIKSPRECESILVDPEKLKFKVFMCNKSKLKLKGTNVLKYVEHGENAIIEIKKGAERGKKIKGYQKLRTIKGRELWYGLGEWKFCRNILPMFEQERKYCFYTNDELFIDAALYYVYAKEDETLLNVMLNSTLFGLFEEVLARPPEGLGALQIKVYHYESMPIIDILQLKHYGTQINKTFNSFIKRKIKPIFEELDIDLLKPIRDQEPNPLPDRKELDDIIFDELGLTKKERREVYWSVCELVKQRLEKAKG